MIILSWSNLDLFFIFIKGDYRTSSKYIESKNGLPISELDFPLLRYAMSLKERIQRLQIIHSKVIETHDDVIREIQHVDEIGHGSNIKSSELNIYYETILNEIYSIMENVARINLFMFDDSYNIPHRFTEQVKKIKSSELSLHLKYNKIISEEMEWYIEVNTIRNNTNHFLTGQAVFSRLDGKIPLPQYLNYNMSNRKLQENCDFRIEKNILESTQVFFDNTMKTLNKIAEIYIERMDKDVPCHIPFFIGDQIEIWALSYNNYVKGEKGKFITKLFNPRI